MNKKGFTLIEIITVIVIIGLILAIATPNIFKFRQRTNEKALKTKIDNLAAITENYIEKNSYDIVDKCSNSSNECICSSFSSSDGMYICIFAIQNLINLRLYNEPHRDGDTCSITDPTDDTKCLTNNSFSVQINLNNNTAHAIFKE